jgi:hypothetical protein
MSDSLMGTCRGCGQTMIADGERCDACAGAAYGGQERHEPMRLFAPSPAPIPGQMALDADASQSSRAGLRPSRSCCVDA